MSSKLLAPLLVAASFASAQPQGLAPADPIVHLRVESPSNLQDLLDPARSQLRIDELLTSVWLGVTTLDGLDLERPWHFFVTAREGEEPGWSAVIALRDAEAFERSLLGVTQAPGFELAENDRWVLVGARPLASSRGPVPPRRSKAAIELRVDPSRLVDVYAERMEAQALARQTFAARFEAFLSGRELEPLADVPGITENARAQTESLRQVLGEIELAVLELDLDATRVSFEARLSFEEGSELESVVKRQRPLAPEGLGRLDPALPWHIWSNVYLPDGSAARSLLTDAFASSTGVDAHWSQAGVQARRLMAFGALFGDVDLELVEWPEESTVGSYRELVRSLAESAERTPETALRHEPDISKLGEVPVDRLTTYLMEPATGTSLEEVQTFIAWDETAAYSAISLGTEKPSGLERLHRLWTRDAKEPRELRELLGQLPEELVFLARFDAGAWDEHLRRLLPEPVPAVESDRKRPATLFHATVSSNQLVLGGWLDATQLALVGQRMQLVTDMGQYYYDVGHDLEYGNDGERDVAQAAEWYRNAARMGNAEAHRALGSLHWNGAGVAKDREEAFRRYLIAANLGLDRAQVAVGNIFFYGYDREPNYEQAVVWFRLAALQNNADAQQKLGIIYGGGWGVERDYATAAEWFRAAAEQGDGLSQLRLGELYQRGHGVEPDLDRAERWYERAAESGEGRAFKALGDLYRSPSARGIDYETALAWYGKGAAEGDPGSQYSLAYQYERGDGTDPKPTEALALYRELAEGKSSYARRAAFRMGVMHDGDLLGTPDLTEAARWFREAAEANLPIAQRRLGEIHFTGRGVERDPAEAMRWFRKAAEQNDSTAASFLGWGLIHGSGIEKNLEEGVRWLRFSAERGNSRGQTGLAECYEYGRGVEKDFGEAFRLYSLAADNGNDLAQSRLGVLYMSGNGVTKDLVQAYKWLLLASRSRFEQPYRAQAEGLLPHLEKSMTAEQIEEARRLAESFVPAWRREP